MPPKTRSILSWVLTAVLAAAYLLAAVGKLTGRAGESFVHWGYAPWFAYIIGALEVAGAVGMLLPWTWRAATVGLSALMLGAAYTHVANHEGFNVLRPVVFLVVLW